MSPGKKTLLVLAGIALVLVLGVFSAFMILVRDESSPPDDSDLLLVRPAVPDAQNAWTYYGQALEKLKLPKKGEDADWPPAPTAAASSVPSAGEKPPEKTPKAEPGEPPPDVWNRWKNIMWGESWEKPLVDEVLKRNADAFALCEKGLVVPECLLPEAKDPKDGLTGAYILCNLVLIRARNLARQGNAEAALDDAMRLVRFGHHIEGGRGVAGFYVSGIAFKGMGLELLGELVRESRLPPDRLCRCAAELSPYQAAPDALANSLRADYALGRGVWEKVVSGEMDYEVSLGGSPMPGGIERLEQSLCKPNRTRRLIADAYREMIAAASKHFADMPSRDKFFDVAWEEGRLAGGNVLGGKVFRHYISIVIGIQGLKCRTNVQVAVTRVLLAMKAFKLEKGRLPATLDELVLAYLDAVPLDDFNGKPLRYNLAKKIVYTVGKDLKDDGGMTKKEYVEAKMKERGLDPKTADPKDVEDIEGEFPWKAPNPAFPIDF